MKILIASVLLLASACSHVEPATSDKDDPLASPTLPGLKTKLIALGKDFAVGAPLKFRLELTNESASDILYDPQGVSAGSLDFTGPDGSDVPYTDIPRQTVGHSALLRPGETVVLFDDYDIAEEYLIARPGRYHVQFLSGGLSIIEARDVPMLAQLAAGNTNAPGSEDQWSAEINKMMESRLRAPSNTVLLDLKPGRPPDRNLFVDRLLKIVPEGWTLGVDNIVKEGDVQILIQKLDHLKSETARVQVLVTDRTLEKLGERTSTWGGRSVYVSANPKATHLWPDFRAKVAQTLAP